MSSRWERIIKDATSSAPTTTPVEAFIDGPEYFKRLATDLRAVASGTGSRYVYILGWMLHVDLPLDGPKDTLLSLLAAAAKTGVEVRAVVFENLFHFRENEDSLKKILNTQGIQAYHDPHTYTSPQSKKDITALRNVGDIVVDICGANTIDNVLPLKGKVSIRQILKAKSAGAHHDKVVIVRTTNTLVAYCGGIDLNLNRLPVNGQHDAQCRVEGVAAYELLQRFLRRWGVLTMLMPGGEFLRNRPLTGSSERPPAAAGKAASTLARTVGTYNTPDVNHPLLKKARDRSAQDLILAAIANAKQYVYIEDQYMTGLDIAKALHKALTGDLKRVVLLTQSSVHARGDIMLPNRMRGEFIDMVLYGKSKGGTGVLDLARRKALGGANLQGVYDKVDFYQITDSPNDAWHEIVHSKLVLVDDELLVIGSVNCNDRSLTHDSESAVAIVDDGTSKTPFVPAFRQRLWTHVLGIGGGQQSALVTFLKNIADPIASSRTWDKLTPAILAYKSEGDDIDVLLSKLLHPYASSKPVVPGEEALIGLAKSAEATVQSQGFRDLISGVTDPRGP